MRAGKDARQPREGTIVQDVRRALAMGGGVVLTAVAMALLASPVLRSGPAGPAAPSPIEGQVRMAQPPAPRPPEAPGNGPAPQTVSVTPPPAAAPGGSGVVVALPAAPPLRAALARGAGESAPALVATADSGREPLPGYWFPASAQPLAADLLSVSELVAEPPRSAGKGSAGNGAAERRRRGDGRKPKRKAKHATKAPAPPVAAPSAHAVAPQTAPAARPLPAAPARPQPQPRKPRPSAPAAAPAPVDPATLARGRHGHVPPGQLRKALQGR